MAQCFRAEGGIVVEVSHYPDDVDLADCFHPDLGFLAVPSGAVPKAGMTWDGKVFGPAPAPAPIVARLRVATSYALTSVLSDDQVAALSKVKAKDQHLFGKRDTPWPEDNPKIARISTALGITPAAWFDAALAPPAS